MKDKTQFFAGTLCDALAAVHASTVAATWAMIPKCFEAHRKDVILEVLTACDALDSTVAEKLSEKLGVKL
jgi:hypothetical protein